MDYVLPLAQFSSMVQKHPDKDYLHQPINRQLKVFTWADVNHNARAIANALQQMGLVAGDRVGILSKNCAEWFMTDLAIMMAGMISVPIYHTANQETIRYIIKDSDCKAVFVGKLDGLIEAEAGIAAGIPRIILPYPSIQGQHQWQSLLDNEPLNTVNNPVASDTMSIAYTSGSTGKPKGVVLTYENFAAAAEVLAKTLPLNPDDHLMSYLPLAHITERCIIENASYYAGCMIFFVESLDTFIDDVKVAQPNLFLSVPRLWVKFQSEILNKMPDKKLQFLLRLPFISKLVAKKIRNSLGLNKARAFGSGTAPISPAILQWYHRIGISISEGWGMTETSGMSCSNLPFNLDAIGTIGKPVACVEMKIGAQQEILIRGAAVFNEYYQNPEATRESFTDGWFHTGDMGAITADGNFKIVGRIKEQFKTAKGKYVAPVPIESLLAHNTDIEQICVIGQGRKQPIALVVMNQNNKQQTPSINQALQQTLEKVNSQLEKHQKLDNIIVLIEDWTVENNLLTPTLKIKRMEIETAFQPYLEQNLPEPVFWET